VREISLRTERRTQLLDITPQVEEALNGADGAAAALVYVPHTTAGVTINEDIDPVLANDLEAAMEKIVEDGWSWRHDDADGPNAPSHVRA
jgi:secondary thiamine-phosphate synthase enzyme